MILIILGLVLLAVGVLQLRSLGPATKPAPDESTIPGLDRRQTRRLLGIAFIVVGILLILAGLT